SPALLISRFVPCEELCGSMDGRSLGCDVGDIMWAEFAPDGWIGPYELVDKLFLDTFRLNFLSHVHSLDVFHVSNLAPLHVFDFDGDETCSDLRPNPPQPREDDGDETSIRRLPVHAPVRELRHLVNRGSSQQSVVRTPTPRHACQRAVTHDSAQQRVLNGRTQRRLVHALDSVTPSGTAATRQRAPARVTVRSAAGKDLILESFKPLSQSIRHSRVLHQLRRRQPLSNHATGAFSLSRPHLCRSAHLPRRSKLFLAGNSIAEPQSPYI
ncbi:Unknown protein, partial [Striga hermonthica]